MKISEKHIEKELARQIKNATPSFDKMFPEQGLSQTQSVALEPAMQTAGVGSRRGGMKKGAKIGLSLSAVTAFLLCVILAVFFIVPLFTFNWGIGGFMVVDINPSVQIELDAKGKVKSVLPLNYDARLMLGENAVQFKGLEATAAAQKLLETAIEHGYISPAKRNNAVLLSLSLDSAKNEDKLKDSVKKQVQKGFTSRGIFGVVLTSVDTAPLKDEAASLGITESKLKLIKEANALEAGLIAESEFVTVSVSEIHSRMSIQAEKNRELVDDELEDEFEEFMESAYETLEEQTEKLLELLDEFAESDTAEKLIEELEELIEELEDLKNSEVAEHIARISAIIARIDSAAAEEPEVRKICRELQDSLSGYIEKVNEFSQRAADRYAEMLGEKQQKKSMYGDNKNHKPQKGYEKNYKHWKNEAEKDYFYNWNQLYESWKADLKIG